MTIQVGDKIPSPTLKQMTPEGPKDITTDELFRGKKVALFAVPGAFTPACSQRHLPGFVDKAADIKAKGVDEIVCVAVNDVFVMTAWGKEQRAEGKVRMLADGSGDFVRAPFGIILRSLDCREPCRQIRSRPANGPLEGLLHILGGQSVTIVKDHVRSEYELKLPPLLAHIPAFA